VVVSLVPEPARLTLAPAVPWLNGVEAGILDRLGESLGTSVGTSVRDRHGADRDPVLVAPWDRGGTVEAAVALTGSGGLVERRTFLFLTGAALTGPAHQWLVHEPGPLEAALRGDRVTPMLADRLPPMIAELRAIDNAAGGGHALSLAEHEFAWVAGLLDRASYDEATGRKLHVALAELGRVAGYMAYDMDDHGRAQRYYITALRAAHAADDRPLGANILSCMARQAVELNRPAEAVTLAETALAGVRTAATPKLHARLRDSLAYGQAKLGDEAAFRRSTKLAWQALERAEPDEPDWLSCISPAILAADTGHHFLLLGKPKEAEPVICAALDGLAAGMVRCRQLYSCGLAEARLRAGKVDEAIAAGQQALKVSEGLNSARSTARIRSLCQEMKPHLGVPVVREFLERARELVA